MPPSTVLVTGASRFVGGQLAARLAADSTIGRILAIDTVPPGRELMRHLGRAEFIQADLRNPMIAKVISAAKVDTVVHTALSADPWEVGEPRERPRDTPSALKETNVIGTMQLLAACQKSATVTRLVVKSTGAVYGASALDQAVFTECDEPNETPASGYAKEAREIEGYIRSFARRRADVDVTVLRFAHIIGPRIDTVSSRYFALPVVPTALGYDPRVQLLHEQDALAVLERATRVRLPGVFNVGGDGVLLLSQAIRRAGRIPAPLPGPALAAVGWLLRSAQLVDYSPEHTRFRTVGAVLDTTRLRTDYGFVPRWSTVAAFDDYVRGTAARPTIDPEWITAAQRSLLGLASYFR